MPLGDTPMQYPYPYKTDDGLLQASATVLPQITVVGNGTVGGSLTVNGALICTGSTAAPVWTGSGSSSGKLFSSQKNIYSLAALAESGYQAINDINATLDFSMASSLNPTFTNTGIIRQIGGLGLNIRVDSSNKFIKLTTNNIDRLTLTDTGVRVENLAASQLVATNANTILTSLAYSVISTASNIVLRDANAFVFAKNFVGDYLNVTSNGTTTTLLASTFNEFINIIGNTFQTIILPDATTLPINAVGIFNNNAGGDVVIQNQSTFTLTSIPVGGILTIILLSNSTVNGTWDYHYGIPSNTKWGTNTLSTPANIITEGGISGPSGTPKFDLSSITGLGKFVTLESTVATGTAPLVVSSTTNVANLNASSLNGATFAAPGPIGNSTASAGNFTGLQVSGLTVSSAVATDGSKNLVSVTNTGTGNNVLAISPSLTTPSLGAATASLISISGLTTCGTGGIPFKVFKITNLLPAAGALATYALPTGVTAGNTTNVIGMFGVCIGVAGGTFYNIPPNSTLTNAYNRYHYLNRSTQNIEVGVPASGHEVAGQSFTVTFFCNS